MRGNVRFKLINASTIIIRIDKVLVETTTKEVSIFFVFDIFKVIFIFLKNLDITVTTLVDILLQSLIRF